MSAFKHAPGNCCCTCITYDKVPNPYPNPPAFADKWDGGEELTESRSGFVPGDFFRIDTTDGVVTGSDILPPGDNYVFSMQLKPLTYEEEATPYDREFTIQLESNTSNVTIRVGFDRALPMPATNALVENCATWWIEMPGHPRRHIAFRYTDGARQYVRFHDALQLNICRNGKTISVQARASNISGKWIPINDLGGISPLTYINASFDVYHYSKGRDVLITAVEGVANIQRIVTYTPSVSDNKCPQCNGCDVWPCQSTYPRPYNLKVAGLLYDYLASPVFTPPPHDFRNVGAYIPGDIRTYPHFPNEKVRYVNSTVMYKPFGEFDSLVAHFTTTAAGLGPTGTFIAPESDTEVDYHTIGFEYLDEGNTLDAQGFLESWYTKGDYWYVRNISFQLAPSYTPGLPLENCNRWMILASVEIIHITGFSYTPPPGQGPIQDTSSYNEFIFTWNVEIDRPFNCCGPFILNFADAESQPDEDILRPWDHQVTGIIFQCDGY